MKVFSSSQMRRIDSAASDLGAIPSIVLMENAAIACVGEILKKDIHSAAIFCGKGNNGGDGFAIARHLYNKKIDVCVYLVCGSDFKVDALTNFEIISRMGIKIVELSDTDLLDTQLKSFDIIIDAIFGTGINSEITGLARDVINIINNVKIPTLSVDIPSGIDADSGKIHGVCIDADTTVTFLGYKTGLLLFPGADYVGKIIVSDISIPEYIVDNENININISDEQLAKSILPKRRKNSNKSDYGKILIIGGSLGMTGACTLSANACIKSGAGLVSVAVCEDLNNIFEAKLTEPMTIPLPSVDGHLDKSCIPYLKQILNSFDVCLFGPGLGRSLDIEEILSELLKVSEIPMIIDADGLFALSKNPSMLEECNCNLILTPHEMEMSRLLGTSVEYVSENRIEISLSYATQNGVTLVLKGPHTIITSPAGEQYININGNNGMACGGSGDVLAGIISALCATAQNETLAAVLGVYLHASSADIACKNSTTCSLTPTDIINNLNEAFRKIIGS